MLLEALRGKDAGGGENLLDRSAILAYSEMRSGTHFGVQLPMLLAGLGNGRLRGNVHASYRLTGPPGFDLPPYIGSYHRNAPAMHLTAVRALGLDWEGYGVKAGFKLPAVQWGPSHWFADGLPARNELVLQKKQMPGPAWETSLFESESLRELMT